jgi:flagellar motor component MotA
MSKRQPTLRQIIAMIIPLVVAFFMLFLAWVWAGLGMNNLFIIHVAAAIIVAFGYPAEYIRAKLDERFDRLEELLKKLLQKDECEESESDSTQKDK